ncbi:hypothetical protein NIES2135_42920 [Leptolyngbya boryana NIES-2135]|uniref:Uncharacterized protein n=1 Tax=Leptolyngbya boryana NIES-2135 TaxID=1973484 RepID=A0A1Z4JLF5_LEPBY|nr:MULTISPECIES: hypothetical protein [Leptolyngbya]MCY6493700.1 hypothetical protein [Leptolyngbya sp. GGD]BAY57427.1 hypothetical protein NIES2135_42920 [Leptolyngbya boryana NIES-2135]
MMERIIGSILIAVTIALTHTPSPNVQQPARLITDVFLVRLP